MSTARPDTTVERNAFADMMAIVGALFTAGFGLYLALNSHDQAMAFHGSLLAASAIAAAGYVVNIGFGEPDGPPATDYMDGPIKVATIAAVIWGIAGFLVGDVMQRGRVRA